MTLKTTEDFLYYLTAIMPLQDILKNLEEGVYRDQDIPFLNQKVNKFTEAAVKSLKLDLPIPGVLVDSTVLNDHNKEEFKKAFTTLLGFYQSV